MKKLIWEITVQFQFFHAFRKPWEELVIIDFMNN